MHCHFNNLRLYFTLTSNKSVTPQVHNEQILSYFSFFFWWVKNVSFSSPTDVESHTPPPFGTQHLRWHSFYSPTDVESLILNSIYWHCVGEDEEDEHNPPSKKKNPATNLNGDEKLRRKKQRKRGESKPIPLTTFSSHLSLSPFCVVSKEKETKANKTNPW